MDHIHANEEELESTVPDECSVSSPILGNWAYSEENLRREGMPMFVATCDLPLGIVEDVVFTNFIQTCIQPRYEPYSTGILRSDIINLFKRKKQHLMSNLNKFTGVLSFTLDFWSGNDKRYIAVTAHYIDEQWIMHKRIIAFRIIEYPFYDGESMYDIVISIIKEFNCENKIRSFTCDNALANNEVIEKLKSELNPDFGGMLFHIPCVSQILNSIVQDGLKFIETELQKIIYAVDFILLSSSRKRMFDDQCVENRLPVRTLIMDVENKWDSTYRMLESCEGYENCISACYNGRHSHGTDYDLRRHEWEISFRLRKFLKVFYDAMNECSGIYYPTSPKVLYHFYNIANNFRDYRTFPMFSNIAVGMEAKFREYWENLPMPFLLATIMDPRINLEGTKETVSLISDTLTSRSPVIYGNVENILCEMYEMYAQKVGTDVRGPKRPSTSNNNDLLTSKIPVELDRYFAHNLLSTLDDEERHNLDILKWWRNHQHQYPIVSLMARDLLTPQASKVASEFAFSAGNRVFLSDLRSVLAPDVLESLMCLKDWGNAEMRIQDEVDKSMAKELEELASI